MQIIFLVKLTKLRKTCLQSLYPLYALTIYIVADSAGKPHQFHVKSNWQPPPQPSVAMERYLERTKFEIASITFQKKKITFQREALASNKDINLKIANKGTTTVIMDTGRKIQKGPKQIFNENFYKRLETPRVSSTIAKVGNIVKTLFDNGHGIDNMT